MQQDSSRRFIARLFSHLTWIILLGLFYLLFQDRLLQQNDPNRNLKTTQSHQPVVLKRNRQGHYIAPGMINGQPVRFLLDTGATDLSIPGRLADELGLIPGQASYASTANGTMLEFFQSVLQCIAGAVNTLDAFQATSQLNLVLPDLCLHRRHNSSQPVISVSIGTFIGMFDLGYH